MILQAFYTNKISNGICPAQPIKDSNIKVGLKPLFFKFFAHYSKISKHLFTHTLFFESFLKTLGTGT
tara:strand:- start:280 stop:480 length:201 start_codon:yes stop_codon:yes gene_type:complete